MKPKTVLILISGVVAVSFAAIFIRMSTAPPLIISFYRMFFSSVLIFMFASLRGDIGAELRKLRGKDILLLIIAGLFLSFHFAFWVTSLSYTSVASSVVLVTTQPLFIVLIEGTFLDKNPSKKFLAGLVVAAAGSFLIGFGDFHTAEFGLIGDVFALLGAIMAAGYFLIGGEVRDRIKILPYILIVYGFSSVFLFGFCLLKGLPMLSYSGYNFFIFLLLALIPTLIGHTSFNWLLKEVKASMVGVTILGEPIGASLLAIIFFDEYPSYWVIAGGSFVLLSIYLLWRQRQFREVV
ncbi:MAG: DMT family transporter [Candidatus Bipolaricaulota bacterium]|nr:DMT family transporter [Candidatus Bipolaricaulota bacterium]MBS3792191.1 DMT family transporter [Candidatus Bipolaricaulota bacterium]